MSASLIPKEEMTELKNASAVKTVADGAIDIQEEQMVAYLINSAANTGEHSAVWEHPLSNTLKTNLESKGYDVEMCPRAADGTVKWIITGF